MTGQHELLAEKAARLQCGVRIPGKSICFVLSSSKIWRLSSQDDQEHCQGHCQGHCQEHCQGHCQARCEGPAQHLRLLLLFVENRDKVCWLPFAQTDTFEVIDMNMMMVMMMTMMTMTAPNNENDMPRSPPLLCRHPHPCSQTSKTPTTHDNDDNHDHDHDDHDDHHDHDEEGKEEVSTLWRVFLNLIMMIMIMRALLFFDCLLLVFF